MVKVSTSSPDTRSHVMQLVDVFRARVVDVAPDAVIIETTGTEGKIDGLLEVLRPYGILELVRTGRVGMVRGSQSVMVEPPEAPRPARRRRRTTRTSPIRYSTEAAFDTERAVSRSGCGNPTSEDCFQWPRSITTTQPTSH